ncbi:MAG: hypothetical protein Q8L26_08340 [Candidatus Omnitrophota bacterium]|nr:hypothetical protein [Candidatus Omnitrophota bacterium]
MYSRLAQDFPAFILLGGFLAFVIYVIIKGNMPDKKDGIEENKKELKK